MPAEYEEDLEAVQVNGDRVLREKVIQLIQSNNEMVGQIHILRQFALAQLRVNADLQERVTTLEALVKT